MSRCLSIVTLFAECLILVGVLLLAPHPAGFAYAEENNPSARARSVPTLESLSHAALPRGVFKGWCGQKDRYLLNIHGQIEAYDAGTKYATIAVSSDWPWQC